jgi:peptidoglycan hydrolase CwlO-like protein
MRKRLTLVAIVILLLIAVSSTAFGCLSKGQASSAPTTSSRIASLETQVVNLQAEVNLLQSKITVLEKEIK